MQSCMTSDSYRSNLSETTKPLVHTSFFLGSSPSFPENSCRRMEKPKVEDSQVKDPIQDNLPQPDLKSSDHAAKGGDDTTSSIIDLSDEPTREVKIEAQGGQSAAQAPSRTSSGSKKSVHWSPELVSESPAVDEKGVSSSMDGSNPYIDRSPAETPASYSIKDTMENVKGVLGRWGRKVGEATKKAEDLAGNTWQHLKTAPSIADAAMGRIAQSTKVLAEGGYEKIFRQTFETVPEEELHNSFACYLSTSAGPVMGTLYLSTAKIAFCSDNPLSYKNGSETEWSYYKVIIPLHQLKAANPSTSIANPSEKYVQVISVDNHEFWFMGFFNYTAALESLQAALHSSAVQSV